MIDEVTPLMFCNYTSGTGAEEKKGQLKVIVIEMQGG
jgi:hypothetical protein